MLAEKEALLVSGLEEFGASELIPTELESPLGAQVCLYESVLIKRLRAGEMHAFNELVEEYQSLVYALALRILGDAEDARDATQETFLKIYRHFARFRGEASLKTWICRIAINQARSTERWWRRRHRNQTTSLDMPLLSNGSDDRSQQCPGEYLASPSATPETETLRRERGRQLELALVRLKKDFRIAVILRDIEGLSYEEIAYATGVSVGTVKSRISCGREMLRERVQGVI
jgi:RNA polymerase sigma-70 factor, ECF subfamily